MYDWHSVLRKSLDSISKMEKGREREKKEKGRAVKREKERRKREKNNEREKKENGEKKKGWESLGIAGFVFPPNRKVITEVLEET